MERWLPVAGYEGLYEVSDHGRVRGNRVGVLRPDINRYADVRLSKDGKKRKKGVHVLMLEAFVGPGNGLWALHRNDKKTDNRLDNLYWGTPQQNSDDRMRNGNSRRGDHHPQRVLDSEMCRWVLESSQSSLALAPILGVASSTIRAVRNGQNWRASL